MYQNQGMGSGPAQYPGMGFPPQQAMPQMVYARIDGDRLVNPSTGELMGYTVKAYEEAVALAQDYEEMLVDHGLIEKEKTTEESLKDLDTKLNTTFDKIFSRLDKVEEQLAGISDRFDREAQHED